LASSSFLDLDYLASLSTDCNFPGAINTLNVNRINKLAVLDFEFDFLGSRSLKVLKVLELEEGKKNESAVFLREETTSVKLQAATYKTSIGRGKF